VNKKSTCRLTWRPERHLFSKHDVSSGVCFFVFSSPTPQADDTPRVAPPDRTLANMAAVAATPDLKRLAFVETAAANSLEYVTGTKVFSKACGYYTSAKETNALKVRRWSESNAA